MAGFIKGVLTGAALAAVAFLAFAYLVPLPPAPVTAALPEETDTEQPGTDPLGTEEDAGEPTPPAGAPVEESLPEPTDAASDNALPAPSEAEAEESSAPATDLGVDDLSPAVDAPVEADEVVENAIDEAPQNGATTEDVEGQSETEALEVTPGSPAQALAVERGAGAVAALPDPTEATPPVDDAPAGMSAVQPAPPLPAWQRHAAAFDAPRDQPFYAVILIDAPADPLAEAKILALTAPVTIALDPMDPDAPRRARAYRSAGHEVVGLLTGATAQAANVRRLPQAVGWVLADRTAWPEGQSQTDLAQTLVDRGLSLVLPEGVSQSDGPEVMARTVAYVEPEIGDRAAVLALFDQAAGMAAENGAVAILGHTAHTPMLEALMLRAGRESEAPAMPGPLSAALAAAAR